MNSQPPSLPLLISAPALAFLLWMVCLALGYRVSRVLRVSLSPFTFWEKGALCLALGAGTLQYEPYLLAALGLMSPRNVLLGFGAITLALLPDLLRVGRAAWSAVTRLERPRLSVPLLVWLVPVAALLLVLLTRALVLTPFGSDDDGYHLAAPRRWLADGTLSYLPSYTNTNAALGFEMLYVLGLASGNWGLKLLHYSAGLFALGTVALCARRLGSALAGRIAVTALLVTSPLCNLPFLFGVAYVDFPAVWMTLTSVLVWLVRREAGAAGGRALLAMALCAGFAGSFKTTALTVAVAWAPILLWEARQRGIAWARIALAAVGLGAVAFLPVAPWMARSFVHTGNPVFPMLSSVIPTRDWNPEIAGVFSKFFHYYSWATATPLSLGQRKLLVLAMGAIVVAAAALVWWRAKDGAFRGLVAFSAISVLISLSAAGLVTRYWLPAEMCLAIALSVALVRRFEHSRFLPWAPALLAVMAFASMKRDGDHDLRVDVPIVLGLRSHDESFAADPIWQMWRYINESTSSDARILVGSFYTTFGASNYGCFWLDARCFTTDSYIQSYIDLRDWPSFARSVNGAGIRYLLVSDQQFVPGRIGFSFTAEQNEFPFVRKLGEAHGVKLAQFGHLQFFALNHVPEQP